MFQKPFWELGTQARSEIALAGRSFWCGAEFHIHLLGAVILFPERITISFI